MLKLKRFEISGFKALDRFALPVEPSLTLLLGMNGSGKSSILQALAFIRSLAESFPQRFFDERAYDRKDFISRCHGQRSKTVHIAATFQWDHWGEIRWEISWALGSGGLLSEMVDVIDAPTSEVDSILKYNLRSGFDIGGKRIGDSRILSLKFPGSLLSVVNFGGMQHDEGGNRQRKVLIELLSWLSKIQSLELLAPINMKGHTRLSPDDMGPRGEKLAGFLASLKPSQRSRVVSRLERFYPIENLSTIRKRAGWIDLVLSENFKNFSAVPSLHMSDGFMRMLALCSIPELPKASLVLLDEIEDGIEPHILGPLVEMVLAETDAQVIATSHSPILANVVGVESLRLVSRTPEGRTIVAVAQSLPAFNKGSEYFGAGELWTNTELAVLKKQALEAAESQEEDSP